MIRVVLPACLAPIAVLAAAAVGGRVLLPLLATLALYPFFARFVLEGRPGAAVAGALLWAAALSTAVIAFSAHAPAAAGAIVAHGPAYRDEMFEFIRSGAGRESDPARFLPQHLLHLISFGILTAISGGLLGLGLGAALVSYMSFYVGALASQGGAPWTAFLLGWPPYALLRVGGFVVLGVLLARPLLQVVARRPIVFRRSRLLWGAAGALLAADLVLKALLAPAWAGLLRPCLAR